MSPNHREALTAQSSISGQDEYLFSTNHALEVTVTGSTGTSNVNLTQVGGSNIALGQTTMSASLPVTLASNQSALPVTLASTTITGTVAVTQSTSPWVVSNSGTFATQLTGATNNINNISGTISLPTGASTSALQTTGNTSLSSIDTKTPALGQALAAASVPVVLTASQLTTLTPLSSVTVTQATGTNLHTVVDSGSITATPPALPSAMLSGQQAATGTAAALPSGSLVNGVIVQALSTNTASVYVGKTGVTTSTGFELQPGQATSVAVANLSDVFIVGNTQSVCWIGS